MPETEGVIQFQLDFATGPPPDAEIVAPLNAWRGIFRALGLLGQDPARYGGFGFGNLSRRLPPQPAGDCAFVISGTQTGGLPELNAAHYVTVLSCDPRQNRVVAKGTIRPSSESLTHGLLYRSGPSILWVLHLHSPEIYRHGEKLGLPTTAPWAACGTPQLADEVVRLQGRASSPDPGLILMGGHEDGILAYGSDIHRTGGLVIETLARAREFTSS